MGHTEVPVHMIRVARQFPITHVSYTAKTTSSAREDLAISLPMLYTDLSNSISVSFMSSMAYSGALCSDLPDLDANEGCCKDWPEKYKFHSTMAHRGTNTRYDQFYLC